MANTHETLTSLFYDIADAIRSTSSITGDISADAFPAYIYALTRSDYPVDPSILNDCPWSFIRWASDEGLADLFWNVGDRKAVSLNAWAGAGQANYQINSGTYYCYILGFNHNSSIEGNNRVHFAFGFDALTSGKHIAFAGEDYNKTWDGNTSTSIVRMNLSGNNTGGWASCDMRNGCLNGSSYSLKTAMPSDLRAVLKTVTKYTDNVGGGTGSVESNVTATTDTIFLMNVFEYRGAGTMNTYEKNYTQQYQYYKDGNSKVRYKSNSTTTNAVFCFRSPDPANSTYFMGFNGSSGVSLPANKIYSVAPCFCV